MSARVPAWAAALAVAVAVLVGYSANSGPPMCDHPMPSGGAGAIWLNECR